MSESPADISRMPSRSDLVAEALARFDTSPRKNSLLELDTVTLSDLGLRLTDRSSPAADAYRWLSTELGGSEDSPAVSNGAFYRFCEVFREMYDQVRAEHARQLARLNVDRATDGNITNMTRLARLRLVEMAAEELVAADGIDDVEKTVSKLAGVIADAEATQHRAGELDIKRRNLERQIEETEAKNAKLQQEYQLREQRIEERLKALQTQLDQLAKRARQGESIDPAIFDRIRDELTGVAA